MCKNLEVLSANTYLQVLEETGITISNVHFAAVENVVFPTGQHYVVIFMQGNAAAVSGLCCYACSFSSCNIVMFNKRLCSWTIVWFASSCVWLSSGQQGNL
jgi:hypothetical protein